MIAFITLSIAGAAALIVASNSDSSGAPDVAMLGSAPATSSASAQAAPLAASAPANMAEPAAAAASASGRPVEGLADSKAEGSARVETSSEGLAALPGMAAAAEAVATQRAEAIAPVSAPVSAPGARHAKSQPSAAPKAPAVAAGRTRPTAGTEPPARDADAELVAAIMARMESPKPSGGQAPSAVSSDRAGTIASLVRDCNAMADISSALACRRRICEGYWGKAQACPRSMAPTATTR